MEGIHVAVDQLRLDTGERLAGRGHVAGGERGTRSLQRAVHGRDRGVEALGDLGGGPAEDVGQQQRRPLARRQVLQRRDERQADALAQCRQLEGIGVRGQRAGVRDRLEPVAARASLERVVRGAGGAFFDRPGAARALGPNVQAHVGGDPVHPGPQRGAAVEAPQAPPGAHHRLLDGVLGVDRRAQHAIAVTRQGGAMGFEVGCFDLHPGPDITRILRWSRRALPYKRKQP